MSRLSVGRTKDHAHPRCDIDNLIHLSPLWLAPSVTL